MQVGCPWKLVLIGNNKNWNLSALSKTKRLFRLFRLYTKTESFGVSIEPKQQKSNWNSLIESIFWYFFRKFRAVTVCFGLFRNSLFWLFRFYTETESFDVSIEPKQTEEQRKQFDREHILVYLRKFRVVSVCFSLFRNSSVCFGCFDIGYCL